MQTVRRLQGALLSGILLVSSIVPAVEPLASVPGPHMEMVRLKDGSTYQGELVEKVMGDHVTLKLATGDIKRFTWDQLQFTTTQAPAPVAEEPPPSGGPPPFPPTPQLQTPLAPPEAADGTPSPEEGRYVFYPRPDRSRRPLDGQRLYAGLGVGWDFPAYFPGEITVGYEPFSWLGVELDARYGSPFGPSIAEMVRIGLPLYGTRRIGIGTGFQESFVTRSTTRTYYAYQGAPETAAFWNLEIFGDTFFSRNLMLRTAAGFSYLMNHNQYDRMCQGTNSQYCNGGVGDPWAAASGQTVYGYIKIDLIWHFHL